MTARASVPRVLHILGSLASGDPQAERCVRLIGAFGRRLRHSMVAADGDFDALASVPKAIAVERQMVFPALGGLPLPGRLQRMARAMTDYHLVLTYGRAGVAAALAHTMFGEVHTLPPLVHHEDGSDEAPRERRGLRSTWLRRIGLGRAAGLVVPNETMEAVALERWHQPLGRVKPIRDGVQLERFARKPKPNGIPRLLKRPGERWIRCFARFARGEDAGAMIALLPNMDEGWHLVLVGDGPGRGEAEAKAMRLALDHRIHFVRELPDRAAAIALFDILAVPSGRTEPVPITVVEAMAAGKPIAGLDASEGLAVLSPDNATPGNGDLVRLAADDYLRSTLGAANRERAQAERGEAAMTAAYRRLYASAMGRETI